MICSTVFLPNHGVLFVELFGCTWTERTELFYSRESIKEQISLSLSLFWLRHCHSVLVWVQLPGPYCITTCAGFPYSTSSAQSTGSCYSISTLLLWGDFCNSVFLCLLSLSPTLCSLLYCARWKLWLEHEDVLGLLMVACCDPPVSYSQVAVIWCGFSLLHGLTHYSTVSKENKHCVLAQDHSKWSMYTKYHFTFTLL